MITKEQFDRFLKNECNQEEEMQVRQFLKLYPEQVASLFSEKEFEEVEIASWDPERSAAFFASLKGKVGRKTRVRKLARFSAIAASVLLIVSTVIWISQSNGANKGERIVAVVQKDPAISSLQVSKWNMTDKLLKIDLPDGSSVSLSPKSGIEYAPDFGTGNERRIVLHGEGYFEVAKNKARPFRVISDVISTTALGTSFTISAFDHEQSIRVRLHTGTVVVANAEKKSRPSFANIYMNPGQQVIYDKLQMIAALSSQEPQMAVSTKIRGIQGEKPEWYQFGGQDLSQVFEQLGNYYGVTINYIPAEVQNRYFTGKFSRADSVESILRDISDMHGFTLEKKGNVYQFRKRK